MFGAKALSRVRILEKRRFPGTPILNGLEKKCIQCNEWKSLYMELKQKDKYLHENCTSCDKWKKLYLNHIYGSDNDLIFISFICGFLPPILYYNL